VGFGPERLVCGSDWPVALLNGDYEKVWRETIRVVRDVAPDAAGALLAGNALRLYRLDAATVTGEGDASWQR
jgi:L-fuconolactonase